MYNIEHDYSGFHDKISDSALPAYYDFKKKLLNESIGVTGIDKCEKVFDQYFSFIDNRHVYYERSKEYRKKKHNSQPQNRIPSIKALSDKTVLLTIPSFDLAYKKDIDSLLEVQSRVGFTENLIIDVSQSPGGGDATFENITPLLYTNPILINSQEIWATENNIQMFKDILKNPDFPDDRKKELTDVIRKLEEHKHSFVLVTDNRIDTEMIDSVKLMPRKVGILISKKCGSATEQFLLLAKQSKKVKIFGCENSAGVLDYSNLRVVATPSKIWYYTVPTSRSTRLPDHPFDITGIKPDVKISKKVSDPVKYIQKYMESK